MLKKYLTMMLLLGLACPATACNSSSSSEDEVPPHLKPETPEEPGRDYYPKADGTTRLVTYNVGVFTKYVSDGSYQMIADMMTEGKADLVGISELDSCTVRTGRVFQLKKFAELMGKEWSYEYSRAMAYQGGAYGDGIASREKPVRDLCRSATEGRRRRTPRDGRHGVRKIRLRHHPPRPCILAGSGRAGGRNQQGHRTRIRRLEETRLPRRRLQRPSRFAHHFQIEDGLDDPDAPRRERLHPLLAGAGQMYRLHPACGTATARSAKWSAPRSCSTSTKATSRGPRIIFPCWSMSNSNAETNS